MIPLSEELSAAEHIDWVRAGDATAITPGPRPMALPAAHANTLHLPVVRSQGLANCGAFAPSYYYKTYQEARERGWIRPDPMIHPERVMSPGFTYPLTNRGENSGAGLATVLNVICRYGIATWADMPESSIWWTYPPDDVWIKALPFRGARTIGFELADAAGMVALKQHLADGDLAVCAVPAGAYFYAYPNGGGVDNGVIYAHTNFSDYHALTLIGYDDDRPYHDGTGPKKGAFLAVNSWGPGWGVTQPDVGTGGFCWLGYTYMQSGRGLETTALAMIDRQNYVPREFAVLELAHQSRRDLVMSIAPGNGPGATNPLPAFPNGGGSLPYYGTITLDITDFMANRPEVYHLWARDWGGRYYTPEVGTIHRFEIVRADSMVMTNRETPVTLVNSDPEMDPVTWQSARLSVGTLEPEARQFWEEPFRMTGFSWIDFNRDERPDFVVFGTEDTSNRVAGLYLNDGHGVFRHVDGEWPDLNNVHIAWGDFNNDGYPDLALSGRTPSPELAPTMRLLMNDAGRELIDSGLSLPAESAALAWGDFDQDGDLDLATSKGRLLRNEGGTSLVDTGLTVLGGDVSFHSVNWVDLNNDGMLDLIINGQINMNMGGAFGGPFHADPLNPPRVGAPGQKIGISFWHDFNGDGLLDAVSGGRIYYDMGYATSSTNPDLWRLWYEPSATVFPNWDWAGLDAADYNHDGLLDLAISGAVGSSEDLRFSVFRQETNRYALPHVWDTWAVETFTDIGLRHEGFYRGGVGWADWDGDGDLDLLAGGFNPAMSPLSAVLANRLAERGRSNAPPSAPQRLESVLFDENLLLRWHPAQDDKTPQTSLGYEVRVGRSPGAADVVSPFGLGPLPGNARLIGDLDLPEEPVYWPRYKNTNGLPGIRLRNMPPGRYYWSARTVDGGRARSPWSDEQAFTITPGGLRSGDINGDGKVDVADLVYLQRMISGAASPDPDVADLNDDGAVSDADALLLASLLLELGVGGFLPVATAEVGPAGGVLTDGTFEMTVPPGAFLESVPLELAVAAEDRIPGGGAVEMVWRVSGLPEGMTGGLTFSAPDMRVPPTTNVTLLLGQWVRPFGATANESDPRRDFSGVPGWAAGGRLFAHVPAGLLAGAESGSAAPTGLAAHSSGVQTTADPVGTFVVDTTFSDPPYLETDHFRIYWEGYLQPPYIVSMAQELEDIFDQYVDMGYPFEDKRDWSAYPFQIWLKELDYFSIIQWDVVQKDGEAVYSTDNGAYVNLNIVQMGFTTKRRTTLYHEFFHVVQGLINPKWAITEAGDTKLTLLSEATASWMERFGEINTDKYVPENYVLHKNRVFDGLSYGAENNAVFSGYAFAAIIEYLFQMKKTEDVVRHIYYTRLSLNGDDPVSAVLNVASPTGNHAWHHDFYHSFVEGTIYPYSPLIDLLPPSFTSPNLWPSPSEKFVVQGGGPMRTTFAYGLPGLGARAFCFSFTPEAHARLTDTSTLAFSVGNPREDLALNVVTATARALPRGTVPVESYGADPKRIRCRIPNLKHHIAMPPDPARHHARSFYPVVSRTDPTEADTHRSQRLIIAVVERLDGNYPIPNFTHAELWLGDENIGFPQFSITSHLNVNDLTGLLSTNVWQPRPGVVSGSAGMLVMQDGRIPVSLYFNAVKLGGTYHDVPEPGNTNDFTRVYYKSFSGFKLSKRLYGGPELEDQPYVFEPRHFSGTDTLALEDGEEHVYYNVSIHYALEMQVYENSQPASSRMPFESNTTPVTIRLQRE